MNIAELSKRLSDRAEDVASMLLPKGKKNGREFKVGGVDGSSGDSMSVCLKGAKAGVWSDFATGESGDLIDLWARVRGQTLAEAITDVRKYLGVKADPNLVSIPREYKRPTRSEKTRKPDSPMLDWLRARGITAETAAAFKLGLHEEEFVAMPYLRDGELVNCKYRSIRDKKRMRQEAGAEPCLFGWHLIHPMTREIAITEGEFDAMVLHQMGIPALSVNAGAGNHQWIENDWDRLDRFSTIYLCYDADEPGQKGASEVANRLGIERCRIVTFGEAKDANDYLLAGATPELFRACLEDGKVLDPEELVNVGSFVDEVLRSFDENEVNTNPVLKFAGDRDWFRYRPGETTTYTGYNGHGKSGVVGEIQIGLMEQGEKFCVFSGELPPRELLHRMVRLATGMSNPTPRYIRHVMKWMSDRFWVFNVNGQADSKRLFEVFRYAARRYGVTHCVIDSLMMLSDVPEDGRDSLERQRKFMVEVTGFGKKYGTHMHLVAHPRKGEDERRGPGKQDVAGSGKITNMSDNVFSVFAKLEDEEKKRNEAEEARESGVEPDDPPDSMLELLKQRNGRTQHISVWTWFDKDSLQHCRTHERRARRVCEETFAMEGQQA